MIASVPPVVEEPVVPVELVPVDPVELVVLVAVPDEPVDPVVPDEVVPRLPVEPLVPAPLVPEELPFVTVEPELELPELDEAPAAPVVAPLGDALVILARSVIVPASAVPPAGTSTVTEAGS